MLAQCQKPPAHGCHRQQCGIGGLWAKRPTDAAECHIRPTQHLSHHHDSHTLNGLTLVFMVDDEAIPQDIQRTPGFFVFSTSL